MQSLRNFWRNVSGYVSIPTRDNFSIGTPEEENFPRDGSWFTKANLIPCARAIRRIFSVTGVFFGVTQLIYYYGWGRAWLTREGDQARIDAIAKGITDDRLIEREARHHIEAESAYYAYWFYHPTLVTSLQVVFIVLCVDQLRRIRAARIAAEADAWQFEVNAANDLEAQAELARNPDTKALRKAILAYQERLGRAEAYLAVMAVEKKAVIEQGRLKITSREEKKEEQESEPQAEQATDAFMREELQRLERLEYYVMAFAIEKMGAKQTGKKVNLYFAEQKAPTHFRAGVLEDGTTLQIGRRLMEVQASINTPLLQFQSGMSSAQVIRDLEERLEKIEQYLFCFALMMGASAEEDVLRVPVSEEQIESKEEAPSTCFTGPLLFFTHGPTLSLGKSIIQSARDISLQASGGLG